MRRIGSLLVTVVTVSLVMWAIGNPLVLAGEVLVNGDLETGVSPVGWTIDTSITGEPGPEVPSVYEHLDGANNPPPPSPGLGLLLHPQIGNQGVYEGQLKQINFVLEQTFPSAVPGRTYTFQGDAFLQDGYSGIVDNLSAQHPGGDYNDDFVNDAADYTVWRDAKEAGAMTLLNRDPGKANEIDLVDEGDYQYWRDRFGYLGHDAIASPTTTTFEMTFLNASDTELDSVVFDLRDDPTTLDWRTHSLVGEAPTGTAKVRVRASALDMIDNRGSELGQDVFFDNFSLKDEFGPERLINGNLNTPGDPVGWTLTEGPTVDQGGGPITADSAAFIFFANRRVAGDPNPTPPPDNLSEFTGQQGLWLRPFVNETQFEPDIPSVEAVLSQVVPGTEGAEYEFSAWSAWEYGYCGGLPATTTETFMKLEFLDDGDAVIGTEMIDLADEGQVNDQTDTDGITYEDWRQFFVNGTAPTGTTNVRVSLGATGMFGSGINPQSAFFDEMSLIETLPGAGGGLVTVPEPGSLLLLTLGTAFIGMLGVGRRSG